MLVHLDLCGILDKLQIDVGRKKRFYRYFCYFMIVTGAEKVHRNHPFFEVVSGGTNLIVLSVFPLE